MDKRELPQIASAIASSGHRVRKVLVTDLGDAETGNP